MKHLYHILRTSILFLIPFLLFSHGFVADTIVTLEHTTEQIVTLSKRAINHKPTLPSYDIETKKACTAKAFIGGKSTCPAMIRIHFSHNAADDIVCTPFQQFYDSTNNCWVCAYLLVPGIRLCTKNNSTIVVWNTEWIANETVVYTIEVDPTHTFFVGTKGLLTHNMIMPEFYINYTPLGSVIGSALCVGYPVIGAILGFAAQFCIQYILRTCMTLIYSLRGLTERNLPELEFEYYRCKRNAPQHNPYFWQNNNNNHQNQNNKNGKNGNDDDDKKGSPFPPPIPPGEKERNTDKINDLRDLFERDGFGKTLKENSQPTNSYYKNSKMYEITKKLPEYELKKGDKFYLDKFHGDHIEVFNHDGKTVRTVLNLDGTTNINKLNNSLNQARKSSKWIR